MKECLVSSLHMQRTSKSTGECWWLKLRTFPGGSNLKLVLALQARLCEVLSDVW